MTTERINDLARWTQTPGDAARHVDRHWTPAGEHGAILRVIDRSEHPASDLAEYYLFPWREDAAENAYQPQNGELGMYPWRGVYPWRAVRIAEKTVICLLAEGTEKEPSP